MKAVFFFRRLHWIFAILFSLSLLIWQWTLGLILLASYLLMRFLFRRELLTVTYAPIAPISGQVVGVDLEKRLVVMRMFWWKGYGCYLPCSGEVVQHKDSSFTLKDAEGDYWRVELFAGPWGAKPQIYIQTGDKGTAGGNVGFISGGGTLALYLPENYEILVRANDRLELGITHLAKKMTV